MKLTRRLGAGRTRPRGAKMRALRRSSIRARREQDQGFERALFSRGWRVARFYAALEVAARDAAGPGA